MVTVKRSSGWLSILGLLAACAGCSERGASGGLGIPFSASVSTAADLDLTGDGEREPLNLRTIREQADRRAIGNALARADGNISNTAKLLGVSRPTLYDLLKGYDIQA